MERDLNRQLYAELSSSAIFEDLQMVCQHPVPGYRLLRVDGRIKGDNEAFELALLCDATKEVAYYNRVTVTSICDLSEKPAVLSLVWRSPDVTHKSAIRDLVASTFFGYILPRYDAIISDGNQTSGGLFFWETQITSSLERGLYVYFYKQSSAELMPIKSRDDLYLIKEKIWGGSQGYQHNLALISQEKLQLERKYSMPVEMIKELDLEDASIPMLYTSDQTNNSINGL